MSRAQGAPRNLLSSYPYFFRAGRAEPRMTTTEQCALIATASEALRKRKRQKPRRP